MGKYKNIAIDEANKVYVMTKTRHKLDKFEHIGFKMLGYAIRIVKTCKEYGQDIDVVIKALEDYKEDLFSEQVN